MKHLDRQQVQAIVNELQHSVARPECLTCDCFQGLLTQLELDCPEDIGDLTDRLKPPREQMHGCLGCDPCPGGELFAAYLKSKNQKLVNQIRK